MKQFFLECGECRALIVQSSDNEFVHTKFHSRMLGYGINVEYRIVEVPSDDAANGAH